MTFYSQSVDQRILVTGASGFIGSHLCDRLRIGGGEVHAVSRTKPSIEKNGLRWWSGDLAEISVVRSLLTMIKPDLIFHLAGHVKGARDLDQVIPTFRSNLMSLVNILTVVSEIGCGRVISAGSMEEPDSGDPRALPGSPYAAAKWAGSAYARMFHALYQVPVVNLRIFMVYGPAQQDLSKIIPYVTLSLLRREAPKLSSGQRQIDWIYVEDVVDGLLAVAQAPNVEGHTIDLGSGSLVSIRAVVQQLVDLVNPAIKPLFGALPDRPMEQVRMANTADTRAKISWEPKTSLQDGLRYTVDWYRERLKRGQLYQLPVS
jgi:UDP-glucose 4-epimerase